MEGLRILNKEKDAVWLFFFMKAWFWICHEGSFSSLSFEALWFVILWNLHKQVTELAKL